MNTNAITEMPPTARLFYLPPPAYFADWIGKSEVAVALGEQYVKQTPLSRCVIKGANNLSNLSVPVERSTFGVMKEARICYKERWAANHVRAIQSAYGRTAFYQYYADDILQVIESRPVFLYELNLALLRVVVKFLGLKTQIILSDEPKLPITDREELKFSDAFFGKFYRQKPYYQPFGDFAPNLSVIDLLFNCGPESLSIIKQSRLVE